MQNEDFSGSQSGESNISETHVDQTVDVGFTITHQDSGILCEYLEFQAADTDLQTRIIEKVMAELYLLHPDNTPFDKKEASKVCGIYSFTISLLMVFSRKYRNDSTTITPALGVTTPNLLRSGPPGMPSIT